MGDESLSDHCEMKAGWRQAVGVPMTRQRLGAAWLLLLMSSAPIAALEARDAREIVAGQCVACHGLEGNQSIHSFPKLAGLQEEYLAKQLLDMAYGARASEIMMPIVAPYSKTELLALAAYFAQQAPTAGMVKDPSLAEAGRAIFQDGNRDSGVPACAGCHRPDGSGTPRSPMLAGQDADYVYQQLKHFQSGARDNDRGRLMRTVAVRMTDQEMRAVSEYIAGMAVVMVQR
ncbi:MAG: cytochrome c4 [Sphingobacteriia bacterium]|nr:cytochrome c4 [Sphingobacteriia bacterium]NCC38565.1 cytochrome c4 [Gammaproteobacteria bacterium]